ncbi:50S ribosomal protein L5 [Candidatus Kaiserbacteria bacterium RIFCSPHIGHO2_01_FULL_50_13]|uniref:Large ribosomal subunit protein uL5 n=1 Tax=Candidatus Kaiserbacteria bacterium RIFCSPLOWO2_01_FULL_50_24 TaxID=1798507 RepID=A0A1F6EIE7_9BACT|nr:MAG: 50S ribosomal protein L5 [Candidatus Kaiserbacteria bacterium RIFCSPHIGHO2_01_FULL_50_13]OGG73424.1 MAG: 50S ribosomal protein L5 [Candidatus Kaiserbacteria bacterium RIFCSPLOWO2_01_FULL_50_24]OGG81307.1 MAG: 50S ribosomal protein L5 [Candidatus Kaiserbacteria bacterium RIFCSPLOWO2_02_FULL_51_13]
MKTETSQNKIFNALKAELGYTNPMQTPRVEKVVVSSGVGKIKDQKRRDFIAERLARITGQRAAPRGAKKAVANFKSRVGDVVGFQVTLRGKYGESFLQKLIHIVLPRVKDFRGIKPDSIDEMGNITIGLKEHTVFPETSDEDSKDVFGLAVTIATTAKNKKEAAAFLRHLGLPLREAEVNK